MEGPDLEAWLICPGCGRSVTYTKATVFHQGRPFDLDCYERLMATGQRERPTEVAA